MIKKKKTKRISKNTAYKRGRAFEYRVKKHFEKLGYYVKRSYASKGAEDLIAMKAIDFSYDVTECICSEVLLIQCKNLKVEKKLDKKEAKRLKDLAKQCGATPLLASNLNHKLNITEVELLLVTKQGSYKAKIPTQFRTKKSKKKVLKREGNKYNYEITKCVICSKRKMERYDLKDPKGELFRINRCKNCNFQNASVVTAYNNAEDNDDDPYVVTYFSPKALEDKS